MTHRHKVLFLTPAGVGGIGSFSKSVRSNWNIENPRIMLWKVPRSNILGWIAYIPWLLIYFNFLIFFRPSVVHVNLASKGSPVRKWPFVLLAKILGIQVVTQLHSGTFDLDYLSQSSKAAWRFFASSILQLSSKIIFINQKQMSNLIRYGVVRKCKATFLPNPAYLPEVWEHEQPVKIFDAVFIGRVSKEKGALDLIEAIKLLDGTAHSFAFVGKVLLPGYSQKSSLKINQHEITFLGELSHLEAMKVLISSKMLILPSHSENFPMVILEAFARGRPVISTRVGEIENIVSDFKDGRLFEVGHIVELSQLIQYYLDAPEKILMHGAMARQKVEKFYDIKNYPKKLVKIYFSNSGREL